MNHTYQTSADFTQAAFDRVAELVSQHAASIIMDGLCAPSAVDCLDHLSAVAMSLSYDASRIVAHSELIQEQNDYMDEFERQAGRYHG